MERAGISTISVVTGEGEILLAIGFTANRNPFSILPHGDQEFIFCGYQLTSAEWFDIRRRERA